MWYSCDTHLITGVADNPSVLHCQKTLSSVSSVEGSSYDDDLSSKRASMYLSSCTPSRSFVFTESVLLPRKYLEPVEPTECSRAIIRMQIHHDDIPGLVLISKRNRRVTSPPVLLLFPRPGYSRNDTLYAHPELSTWLHIATVLRPYYDVSWVFDRAIGST